jgi:hypothetical protein
MPHTELCDSHSLCEDVKVERLAVCNNFRPEHICVAVTVQIFIRAAPVRISAGRPTIMIVTFTFKSFPVYHASIFLIFVVVEAERLATFWNKEQKDTFWLLRWGSLKCEHVGWNTAVKLLRKLRERDISVREGKNVVKYKIRNWVR